MRLFHVSEDADIRIFKPRYPTRADLDPTVGLIWAIDEAHLPNFLTPRDCPRVTYHAGPETSREDRQRFFSSATIAHAVVIEHAWFDRLRSTTLYLYEFDPAAFTLQDEIAGYYVATTVQTPIKRHMVDDLPGALVHRGVELRIVDHLQDIADAVKQSTLRFSLCRMRNASTRT